MRISKKDARGRVETYIAERLDQETYQVEWVRPCSLLSWNRLDVAFRILFLELREKNPLLARELYRSELRAQTMGSFVDPDNKRKAGFDTFQDVFVSVAEEIRDHGFKAEKTLLPLSASGSILNGSHRLAAAIHHDEDVAVLLTGLPEISCNFDYFWQRGVPVKFIEMAVIKMVERASNCFVAFLWPSGHHNLAVSESLFPSVIYQKRISLTDQGKLNLLAQCYRHMDWTGSERAGFPGLHLKLSECFPNDQDPLMIVFQSFGGIEEVRALKKKIRDLNGIGYSSVHISDDRDETLRLVSILCNANGLHYLNHSPLLRDRHLSLLQSLAKTANHQNVSEADFMIDGSWLLEIYGIRESEDVDLMMLTSDPATHEAFGTEPRHEQLRYHEKPIEELLFNQENFFWLYGVKIVGFEQLRRMKVARSEAKDGLDIRRMDNMLENRGFRVKLSELRQSLFFFNLRLRRWIRKSLSFGLRAFGLYKFSRAVLERIRSAKPLAVTR